MFLEMAEERLPGIKRVSADPALSYLVHVVVVPFRVDASIGGVGWGVRCTDARRRVVDHVLHNDALHLGGIRIALDGMGGRHWRG